MGFGLREPAGAGGRDERGGVRGGGRERLLSGARPVLGGVSICMILRRMQTPLSDLIGMFSRFLKRSVSVQ